MNADASTTPEVPRVHRPSPERFRRDFAARARPVVLTGIASEWPAVSRWTPSFFRDRIGDAPVRVVVTVVSRAATLVCSVRISVSSSLAVGSAARATGNCVTRPAVKAMTAVGTSKLTLRFM